MSRPTIQLVAPGKLHITSSDNSVIEWKFKPDQLEVAANKREVGLELTSTSGQLADPILVMAPEPRIDLQRGGQMRQTKPRIWRATGVSHGLTGGRQQLKYSFYSQTSKLVCTINLSASLRLTRSKIQAMYHWLGESSAGAMSVELTDNLPSTAHHSLYLPQVSQLDKAVRESGQLTQEFISRVRELEQDYLKTPESGYNKQ